VQDVQKGEPATAETAPVAQGVHVSAPAAENEPASQDAHVELDVADTELEAVP
jgi:hypothetical protein